MKSLQVEPTTKKAYEEVHSFFMACIIGLLAKVEQADRRKYYTEHLKIRKELYGRTLFTPEEIRKVWDVYWDWWMEYSDTLNMSMCESVCEKMNEKLKESKLKVSWEIKNMETIDDCMVRPDCLPGWKKAFPHMQNMHDGYLWVFGFENLGAGKSIVYTIERDYDAYKHRNKRQKQ
jgi:uncharacterized protein YjeT (DUF2065 family)